MIRTLLLFVAFLLTGSVGTFAQQGDPTAPRAKKEAPKKTYSEADIARRAGVYAQVGDVKITVGDIEDSVNQMSPFLRLRMKDPEKLKEHAFRMVRFELLAMAAKDGNFDKNPAVVKSVKQNSVQQLIRTKFDEKLTPDTITDEDIQKFYDANSEEFRRPQMSRASHIRVATLEEAKAIRNEALGKGQAKGEPLDAAGFRKLARKKSTDDETKLRGGDLRYFTEQGRPPKGKDSPVAQVLVDAAFKLKEVGDLSQPVKNGDSFSIVKLTGRRPEEIRTVKEAGQGIRLRLWREKRQKAIEEYVSGLRMKHAPEIFEDRMKQIRLDDPKPSDFEGDSHGTAKEPKGQAIVAPKAK